MAEGAIIFAVKESAEGSQQAKALGISIHTQTATLQERNARVRDAVRCRFEAETKPCVNRRPQKC